MENRQCRPPARRRGTGQTVHVPTGGGVPVGQSKGVVYGDLCDHELHARHDDDLGRIAMGRGGLCLHEPAVHHCLGNAGHAGQTAAVAPAFAAHLQLQHGRIAGLDACADLVRFAIAATGQRLRSGWRRGWGPISADKAA